LVVIFVQFIHVIYRQTCITVNTQMFKDILHPTLRSVQNPTLDGRIMYLTGTLVSYVNNNK